MPHPLPPIVANALPGVANTLPPGSQPWSGVVMQKVPFDPLAGPVKLKRPAKAHIAARPDTHAATAQAKLAPKAVAKAAKPGEPVVAAAAEARNAPPAHGAQTHAEAHAHASAQAHAKPVAVKLPPKPAAVRLAVKASAVAPTHPSDKAAAPPKPVAAADGVPALRLAAAP
jgi:hypothetical protein